MWKHHPGGLLCKYARITKRCTKKNTTINLNQEVYILGIPLQFIWAVIKTVKVPPQHEVVTICRNLMKKTETASRRPEDRVHSKKKSTSEHLFWCFRLSQIEDYSVPGRTMLRMSLVHLDPKIPIMVLPGTIWSFQVY